MNNPSPFLPKLLSRSAALAVLFMVSANLYAQQPMSITLTGSAEVPPVNTSATGSGQIEVLSDHTVSGTINVSGLVPTMAHIHEAAVGKNGPPIITLTQTASDSFVVPAGARLTDAQFVSFTSGKLYLNVHSARHPSGEIRGQLLRTDAAGAPTRAAD